MFITSRALPLGRYFFHGGFRIRLAKSARNASTSAPVPAASVTYKHIYCDTAISHYSCIVKLATHVKVHRSRARRFWNVIFPRWFTHPVSVRNDASMRTWSISAPQLATIAAWIQGGSDKVRTPRPPQYSTFLSSNYLHRVCSPLLHKYLRVSRSQPKLINHIFAALLF